MKRSLLVVLLFTLTSNTILVAQPAIERRVDSLMTLMTLDEKVGQLVQYSNGDVDRTQLIREGKVGSMLNVLGTANTGKLQRIAVEESRLKIPLIFGFDVIHGYRTTFPIPLATSCTWDPALIEKAERVAAIEATASGINWTFAPMLDIARDPRWGRIAEGAGEDPYLGSVIAAARVRGFQGSSLADPASLLACAKHFAAYGAAEGGRDYNTVDLSERTLREVYLPPFHAAVQAGVGTLMCSFNEIAGVPSSGNRMLLTDILRGEWGFDGFVVSDWGSIGEMLNHGNVADTTQAAILALHAGVDMDMESGCYGDSLASAVEQGLVPMVELNEAVRRILREKFRLGLFDNPYKNCDAEREQHDILTPAHRQLARAVADQSVVLLRNQGNLLPLKKSVKSIALVGPLADDQNDPLGPWSGHGNANDVVTVLQGIKAKLSSQTKVNFARGCDINDRSADGFKEALNVANQSDVVIAVVGESAAMSGEAASRSFIGLPGNQEDLLRALQATGKPLVVVLMNGRPLAIPWIAEHVPAIVESWFLGVESGNAIADVLFGDYNPGGKLTTTFPRATGQVSFYYNHKNSGRPAIDSVKWTSKYIDLPIGPQYPFGYGLSYTTFSYGNIKLSSENLHPNDSIVVSAVVKNTGDRTGEEIAQLYVHDEVASITRPVKELKGFQRISLKPGESKTVQFILKPEQLTFYNISMQRVVEPGTFKVFVGPNSAEGLEGEFNYATQ
jgi:beta-glucosidase